VENLSHLVGPVPATSQGAGQTTADAAEMSGPGSPSEGAPDAQRWMGMEIPPQRGPTVTHAEGSPRPDPWTMTAGRPWVQASPDESPPGGNRPQSGGWSQS